MINLINNLINTCHICNKPLLWGYLYDVWDNKMCESHLNRDAVHCASCSAFTRKEHIIPDGRVLCKSCYSVAIKPGDQIDKVKQFVIYKLYDTGFNDLRIEDVTIGIVSAQKMAEIRRAPVNLQIKGFNMSTVSTTTSLGILTSRKFKHNIFMLTHLTNTEFVGMLAHEMLHAWLVQNGVKMSNKMEEGFCNMGSYLMYSSTLGELAKMQLKSLHENPDPIYGDGFREMYDLFKRLGWKELIRNVKEKRI